MKSLIFQDQNLTVNVEYVTDLISSTAQNFTIMSIKDRNNTDPKTNNRPSSTDVSLAGLLFKKLPGNLSSLIAFAAAHDLKLTLVDYKGAGTSTVLQDFTGQYANGGLGIDNI